MQINRINVDGNLSKIEKSLSAPWMYYAIDLNFITCSYKHSIYILVFDVWNKLLKNSNVICPDMI